MVIGLLTMPTSSATITIDVNDVDFPIGAAQTEGTNPIIVITVVKQYFSQWR